MAHTLSQHHATVQGDVRVLIADRKLQENKTSEEGGGGGGG